MYEKKQFLGVSGDGDLFEVFDVLKLKANEFLSKFYPFLFPLLWRSDFHKKEIDLTLLFTYFVEFYYIFVDL